MASPRRSIRSPLIVVIVAVVSVLAVVAVGFAFLGWGSTGSSGPSAGPPLPHLAITFAAYDNSEVETLLSTVQPYIQPGDSIDLVSGSPSNSSLSVTTIDRWAGLLRTAFPNVTIYAHTSGLQHYSNLTEDAGPNVTGVLYDYEPGYEPEFTFNFTQTVAYFENATAMAHAHGLLSVGYPTGRPVREEDLRQYGWDYATLALAVDRMVIQTQSYCADGPTIYAQAIGTVMGQYEEANLTKAPTFQITIGNSTTTLRNGVTAVPAYDCATQLTDQGLHSLYLWWDVGGTSNLVAFLQDIGRHP